LSQAPYPIYLLRNIANITLLLEDKESGNKKIEVNKEIVLFTEVKNNMTKP
ncbi:MAG: hypothetical protein ACI9IL_000903, partial [Rickettsiales bacterium]